MSFSQKEKPLGPDGREAVETEHETEKPELSFFSGFWDLFLLRMFLQEGSC